MLTLECNAGIRKKNTLYFVYKFSCNRQLSFELFVMSFILAGLFSVYFFITHLRSSLLVWSLLGTFLLLLFPFFRFVVSFYPSVLSCSLIWFHVSSLSICSFCRDYPFSSFCFGQFLSHTNFSNFAMISYQWINGFFLEM